VVGFVSDVGLEGYDKEAEFGIECGAQFKILKMKKFNFFIQTQNFENERISIETFEILKI